MARYVGARLLWLVPTLVLMSFVIFLSIRLVPGDPAEIMLSGVAPPSTAEVAKLRHEMGLDQPILTQYVQWADRALHGDLGTSFRTRQPVMAMIEQRFPNTLKLVVFGMVVGVVIGIGAGVVAATHRGGWIDTATVVAAVLGVSTPGFWLGLMLILFFAVDLRWLPAAGSTNFSNLVLPSFTLGLGVAAVLARITRAGMLDVLGQEFIQTARAKGLSPSPVNYRHALKNALIPVITIVGLQIGALLSGAFIIEDVFGYPGVGQLAVFALDTRDFPLIQGITLVVATIYVLTNLGVDLLYAVVDPRIKY